MQGVGVLDLTPLAQALAYRIVAPAIKAGGGSVDDSSLAVLNCSLLSVPGNRVLFAFRVLNLYVGTAQGVVKETINTALIPPMWRQIQFGGRLYPSGVWGNSHVVLSLLDMNQGVRELYSSIVQDFSLQRQENVEDPRLYIKADDSIALYYVTTDPGCAPRNEALQAGPCAYIKETVVHLFDDTFSLSDTAIIPCINLLRDKKGPRLGPFLWTEKNWSPWRYNGSDYFTYLLNPYTIYKRKADGIDCDTRLEKAQPVLTRLKEIYAFYNSRGESRNFFSISLTTPAVTITTRLGTFKIGVAHVRVRLAPYLQYDSSRSVRVANAKELQVYLDAMGDTEQYDNIYLSLRKLLSTLSSWYVDDLLYSHPDVYMMCMYMFDPASKAITYMSRAFIPVVMQGSVPSSRTTVYFPCSINVVPGSSTTASGDKLAQSVEIGYGEADLKVRILTLSAAVLDRLMLPYDDTLPESFTFEILHCPATQSTLETRTVSQLLEAQYPSTQPLAGTYG